MNATNETSKTNPLCGEDAFYFYSLVIIHVFTFLANFVSALAIWRLPGLERNKYHLVVRTLIVSDCLIPISSLPMPVISYIHCGWVGGELSCILSAVFSTIFRSWSALIVTGMCLMRFLAVKKPLFYRHNVTFNRIKKALAIVFIWCCCHLALPSLSGLGKFTLQERGMYCALDVTPRRPKDLTLVYITIIEGCVVILAMLYFSVTISVVVKKKRKVSSSLSVQQQRGVGVINMARREKGFAKITIVIVMMYCICYVPFLVSH